MNGFTCNPFDSSGSKELLFILQAANGWQISFCSDAVNSKCCLWLGNVYVFYGSHLFQRDHFFICHVNLAHIPAVRPSCLLGAIPGSPADHLQTLGSSCPPSMP